MSEPLYSIGTWDPEERRFSQHKDLPAFNLTRKQLVEVMRALQEDGYPCHRYRWRNRDGEFDELVIDSDPSVLIERTDGMPESEILERWKR